MQKRPVGRPKKANAKKPGQLKKGECRFTFITTKEKVEFIKNGAKSRKLSVKEFMNQLINKPTYFEENIYKNLNKNRKNPNDVFLNTLL
jgi:hypothetical protein